MFYLGDFNGCYELFFSEKHFGKVPLDKVNEDHGSILIPRRNGKPAVIMSLEDFKSYEETAYLMSSSKNAGR